MTRAVCLATCLFAASSLAHAEGEPAATAEPAVSGEHAVAGEAEEHHHGPFEMRVSVESPLYVHASDGSKTIGDEFELEPDVMFSYVLEEHHMSLDLEIGEAFLLHSSEMGTDTPERRGTVIRPGVAYSPSHELPIFLAALLPMHLEPSPFLLSLRLGAGVDFHTPIGKYFIEADVDFPLAGGSGAPDAFKEQALVLATGLLFHLPG